MSKIKVSAGLCFPWRLQGRILSFGSSWWLPASILGL